MPSAPHGNPKRQIVCPEIKMLKPKRKITTSEENSVFLPCFVWYLSYGWEKSIVIICVDFLLFLGLERHAGSYHLTNKVWWCSTTTGVQSLALAFASNLERGRRRCYCCCRLLMAICILLHRLLFFLHLLVLGSSSLQKSH